MRVREPETENERERETHTRREAVDKNEGNPRIKIK